MEQVRRQRMTIRERGVRGGVRHATVMPGAPIQLFDAAAAAQGAAAREGAAPVRETTMTLGGQREVNPAGGG